MEANEFIYVGDVMCSWCWGFAPTIQGLGRRFTIPIRLVNGGLRPGSDAQKLDDGMRAMLQHHWNEVAEMSGQPFDQSVLDRDDGWVYDTELPAMATVTVREMAPALTLPVFERLQRAFYADGVDITDPSAYRPLIETFDLDAEVFLATFTSESARWKAWEDFDEARSMGVNGFPTLLLRTEGKLAVVTRGYAPLERIAPAIEAYLHDQLGPQAAGFVCALDDPNC